MLIYLWVKYYVIIARSVFQEDNKYYPGVHLHEYLYEFEHKYEDDCYFIV